MSDQITQLEKTYCPPLDSALFFAIISDYDLTEGDSLSEVRLTLDALKESAEIEESTAFDPSGSNRQHENTSAQGSPERAQSWHGDARSGTEETDLTSLSHGLDSIGINGASGSQLEGEGETAAQGYDLGVDDLSTADKEALLSEMFPDLKLFDICFALRKCKDNFGKTVEELLNQVFLSEEQVTSPHLFPRGIDAFIDHDNSRPTRKNKGKRRKKVLLTRRSSSTPAPLSEKPSNNPTLSKWDLAKQDVDFVTQRTYLSPQTVTSMYHKSGASLRSTLLALCASDSLINPYIESTDPIIQSHACELAQDFPNLPPRILTALIYLTHPSTTSAHELALAITSHPSSLQTTQLLLHHIPPTLTTPSRPPAPKATPTLSHQTATSLANAHTTSSHLALTTASSAYRTSRSQPLMSHASSYYATLARTRLSTALHYRSLAADALVSTHSSPSQIDLHGVSVADGVRITREKVQAWWEGGQAEWAREGKVRGEGGFRIITGVGRHSEGGRGRLGPAVGGMLVKEGWRVEVGEGVLVVRGRARR